MKKLIFIFLVFPVLSSAQIYDYRQVFTDSLEYKDFNQGYKDAQD